MATGAIPSFDEFKSQQGAAIPSFEEFKASSAAKPPPLGEQPASVIGVASTMADQSARFLGALWENVNPVNLVKAGLHPIDTAHHAFGATVDALDRTEKAIKEGNHQEALTSMVGAIPLLGPAGEQIVRDIEEGRHAEALGHAAGLRLAFESPKLIPKIPAAATAAGEAVSAAGSKVTDLATKPAVLKAGGAVAGAAAGHATGIPYAGYAGAYIGRQVGKAISKEVEAGRAAKAAAAEAEVAPAVPAGIDPQVWEKLPPVMQEQLRQKMSGVAPAPPVAPVPQPPRDPSYYGIQEVAPEPEIAPIEPPPAPKEAPAGSELTEKLNKLKRDWAIKMGDDPNVPFGEKKGGRYQAKWDEGSNEPIVQSELRKPHSTAEPANPFRIAKAIGEKLAGRITVEQFDSMSKNPKALAVITRQYGIEPDAALLQAIRRRIAAKSSGVTKPSTISISDLMKR